MKTLLAVIITLTSLSTFAAQSCKEKVINAVVKKEFPNGVPQGISIDSSARLTSPDGSVLNYRVKLKMGYNDGASSMEFPEDIYTVLAYGTKESCSILLAKRIK
jgi:hypothetical protein